MLGIKIPYALYLLAAMWLLQFIQSFIWPGLDHYGILPRTLQGGIGIAFAPWIHHGWWHLISNSLPFIILGTLIELKSKTLFWEATLIISVISGVITWTFGTSAYHAGASGLILGYWSFILAEAYYSRSIKSLVTALAVLVFYAGFIFVVFDFRTHISWVGHMGGLVAGIIVAKLYVRSENKKNGIP